ncbi:MAG: tetratricopeptide repeat protein [Acidobacteriota bacterium]|nr:tetratricopeptide repeat protein [Acidobacteriota bacterium]
MGRLCLFFAIVPLVSLLAATPSQNAAVQKLSQQAAAARDNGRVDDALTLYRRGVALQPAWAEGWWNLGTLQYDRGSFAPAREAFSRLLKLEPAAAPGWALRGLCEFELKQYRPSLDDLQHALRLGLDSTPPLSKVTRYHAALLLTKSAQFQNALQLYSQLAALGAEDRDTILGTGLAGLRLPLFTSELPADREEFVYQVGHAIQAGALHREAEARKEFEAMLAANPRAPELHNLLGQLLLQSDPDAALEHWKQELAVSPNHTPAMLQIAYEYLKRGEAAAGLPYARQAVALEPESFVAHNALGRLLVASGDLAGGIPELEKAKQLAPDSPDNRIELASAYAKAGRSQDAARERAEFTRLKNAR